VVVIAQDVQGAEVARPWVEKAGATYRALLDQHNEIGKAYGLKYVPVGIALDAEGRLVRPVRGVDIGDDVFRAELMQWAASGAIPDSWRQLKGSGTPAAPTLAEREADARFQLAIVSLEGGDKNQAVAELKRAVQLDAKNWLIRKQLWALEAPEAFYGDAVDYAWQKVQMQREAEGLLAE
jgi:hypothetical protein